ncbi:hypothetical protein LTV02_04595 [Nocardia yamanashiensis]|uniref:DUF6777 domain-containing protein n=1 Tax=Nocardia yamanashiensis TaxID=209247 RepID=UPI001E64B572|nr:DUF6777 domain-containing protein [Nocardia yamanashiensis]UGT42699.1 hypothetical protein LTV02_04595 [Nocardia yamanashiensis]
MRKYLPLLQAAGWLLVGTVVVVIAALRLIAEDEPLAGVLHQAADFGGIHPFLTTTPVEGAAQAVPSTSALPARAGTKTAGGVRIPGDEPGVYGGFRDQATANAETLIDYYANHAAERRGVVRAFTDDTEFRWAGTGTLTEEDLTVYLRGLTPALLRFDIRVTDHEFRDGKVTPFETVLQRGTSVFIDAYGVPRVRGRSGSPLTVSTSLELRPVYSGTPWTGFDKATVIVVTPTPDRLTALTLADLTGGTAFDRPVGTNGRSDRPPSVTVRPSGR